MDTDIENTQSDVQSALDLSWKSEQMPEVVEKEVVPSPILMPPLIGLPKLQHAVKCVKPIAQKHFLPPSRKPTVPPFVTEVAPTVTKSNFVDSTNIQCSNSGQTKMDKVSVPESDVRCSSTKSTYIDSRTKNFVTHQINQKTVWTR